MGVGGVDGWHEGRTEGVGGLEGSHDVTIEYLRVHSRNSIAFGTTGKTE